MRNLVVLLCLTVATLPSVAADTVIMNTDEAEAVLSILDRKAADQPVRDSDWERLFTSEPYVRLKAREAAMKRDFTDDEFRTFVLSEELFARRATLREALDQWATVDLHNPRARALAYLPEGAVIRAKVYPVIKPKTNSFVFDLSTDPAIFMYLDPSVTAPKLANTLAHEFHHIGFDSSCPTPETESAIDALPENTSWVVARLGAFGEGFAMLAAAGGPDVHPHEVSPAKERSRWDSDLARAPGDFEKLEAFMLDSIKGTLSGDARQKTFFSFYGEQGPWYTIGWLMASTIERELGHEALLDAFCDTRTLLSTYNRAAARSGRDLPMWSDQLLAAISSESADGN